MFLFKKSKNVQKTADKNTVKDKTATLDELSMFYEVSVQAFFSANYAEEFFNFYEIKNRNLKLIPSEFKFYESMRELCGYDRWKPVAEKTESLFGQPKRITVFEDTTSLFDELEGPDGLAPLFFVFDLMFYEYEGFTLCFISGTNN